VKNEMLALYRVHEGPNEEKLNDLRRFLNEMALKMPGHRAPVPADYAHILRIVKDRPDAKMIQTVLLRSMSQAVYSSDNKGHFGLAYDAYTHFTSPIRRYPDLLVHRAIKQVLAKKPSPFDAMGMAKAGEHCSTTERRADDATHEVADWLKCEFMMDKVGNEYEGVVSGVMGFGIFVELKDIYVEGLVHISTLPEDYYQFDPAKHALVGDRTGRQFRLGDPVKVKVARVDLDQCQMDFVLAEGARPKVEQGSRRGKSAAPKSKKPKYPKNTKNTKNIKKPATAAPKKRRKRTK
jgi:ribonuclease R